MYSGMPNENAPIINVIMSEPATDIHTLHNVKK